MARTKEACMIILDVGKDTLIKSGKNEQTFFERAKNCVSKIVQRKIFSKPQDEVGLLLMGTEETNNQLNVEYGGYQHISEAFELNPSNWQMLRIMEKQIHPSNVNADWFDALVVAMNFLKVGAQAKKFASLKIILVSALSVSTNLDEDQMEAVIQKLTDMPCELNVINDTVEHQTESDDQLDDDHSVFEPLGIFSQLHHKSKEQQANEKILSDVVFKSNGALCNIDSAELLLVHFEKKATRAAPWNSIMSIGTQIQINVSAYLLITEEKGLGSFKTVSTDPNAAVQLKTDYFKNDKQFEPDYENVISGYMYGSTVVPYDIDIDIDYKSGEQRLSCLGFTMAGNILEEYLCGTGTHVVVAKKDCQASEAKLSALVKAMIDLDVVMIATKVYRRDTRPKINVLMPTYRKRYPCLIMLELCFQEEVALLKFPPLLSSKHKPTDAQYEAMEKLIDSMDLLDALDDDAGSKEAFALHKTLNPIHQHMFRTVAHRALHPKAPIPTMDEELKKLVDVPPKVRERSKPVLEEVKNLFPLKEIKVNARIKWLQRANKITAHPDATGAGPSQQIDINDEDGLDDQRTIVEVGTVTPAEDFALLLKRGEKFATLCVQIQNVISDLVFKSMTVQYEKVAMAMMMYREEAKIMGPYRLTCLSTFLLLATIVLLSGPSVNGNTHLVHRRFEYKYSFKPPYLAQKDGTVPFWEYGGNAIASSENVRIAPSLRSQKGAIWTKQRTNFDWWEVDIVFRVSGRGRIGADGLAFWYTTEKGDYTGEVFGSSDRWVGLGIFFDSFDNDNKHNNPYISAVLNDGTKRFDHTNDGSTQLLSGCLRDFRNKPFPTRAKIEYYNNILTVLFHNGMTNNDQDYEMCFRAENVVLPKTGYFGVSAATGGLADDHDVFHFLTTSLHVPGQIKEEVPHDQDQAKLTQEYQDYQKKLELQKEEYQKEHPELQKEDAENWFEDYNARELRQIWEAQTATHDQLRTLNTKLDEVIGRQERTLGLLSVQGGGGVPPPHVGQQQPGGAPQIASGSAIQRHEVDALLRNQNVLVQTVTEIRSIIGEVNARADSILTNQARAPTAQIQGGGYDVQTLMHEMRDGMNQVKQGMASVTQRLQQPSAQANVQCPTQTCLGMTTFLVTIMVHLLVIVGYNMYRDSRDAQAKKFY